MVNRYLHKLVPPSAVAGPEDTKEILEVKHSRGKLYYLIDWKGFGPEDKILGTSRKHQCTRPHLQVPLSLGPEKEGP